MAVVGMAAAAVTTTTTATIEAQQSQRQHRQRHGHEGPQIYGTHSDRPHDKGQWNTKASPQNLALMVTWQGV